MQPRSTRSVEIALLAVTLAVVGMLAVAVSADVRVAAVVPLALAAVMAFKRPMETSFAALVAGPLLFSPFLIGPVTVDSLLVLFGLGVAIISSFARGRIPLALASIVALAIAAAGMLSYAYNGLDGGLDLVRFIAIAVAGGVAADSSLSQKAFTWTVQIAVSIGAISLLIQPIIGFPAQIADTETAELRNGGLFGHPNFAAYCLALAIIWLVTRPRISRVDFILVAVWAAAFLTSGARIATLTLALTLLVVLLPRARRLLSMVLLSIAGLAVAGTTLLTRLGALGQNSATTGDDAMSWRIGQWGRALALFPGNEAVGIGRGQIEKQLPNGLGAHSAYVQSLVEFGVIGSALIAIAILAVLIGGVRSLSMAAMWVFALVSSVTDPVLFYPSTLTLLTIFTARQSLIQRTPREDRDASDKRSHASVQR